MDADEVAERLAALEERVARLEGTGRRSHAEVPEAGAFWALDGLKARAEEPGAVLFTGAADLPTGEHYEWQQGHGVAQILADDWAALAPALSALAHPVRLLIVREILHGTRTAAELGAHERLGTTGQLYHHLRQLVSAGWLRTTARGQYAVPGERVVPLLVVLTAAHR